MSPRLSCRSGHYDPIDVLLLPRKANRTAYLLIACGTGAAFVAVGGLVLMVVNGPYAAPVPPIWVFVSGAVVGLPLWLAGVFVGFHSPPASKARANIPATPLMSPDGQWWWDGTQWRTAVSDDGRWRWTGTAWTPTEAR